MQVFVIPKSDREPMLSRVGRFLSSLPAKRYRVEIKEQRGTRSIQQNRYLWGCVYEAVLSQGGESMAGWTKDDLHEFFLGDWSGWVKLEGMGRPRLKPMNRSSNLSKTEFQDFVAHIQRFMAERGVVIPDPDSELAT